MVDNLVIMHRSRLVGILIDTPAAQVSAEMDFWSGALGATTYPAPGEEQARQVWAYILYGKIATLEDDQIPMQSCVETALPKTLL